MSTYWNGQVADNDYSIQFQTDKKELYKIVERACQRAVDKPTNYKIGFKKENDT